MADKPRIERKDNNKRLRVLLEDKRGSRKNVTFLLSIEKTSDGGKRFHINNQSFENVVKSIKALNELQDEMEQALHEAFDHNEDDDLDNLDA